MYEPDPLAYKLIFLSMEQAIFSRYHIGEESIEFIIIVIYR